MKVLQILFSLSFLFSPSNELDFCVGDLNASRGPSGYPCKKVETVTANDFVFSGYRFAANASNALKTGGTLDFSTQFPGINGLGISIFRADFPVVGLVAMHTHPEANEIVVLIQGTLCAGFISSTNKVYLTSLHEGDVMVFPQGLMHFLINIGKSPALTFSSFSSTSPGIHYMDYAWFANDLPTDILQKTTFLDPNRLRS